MDKNYSTATLQDLNTVQTNLVVFNDVVTETSRPGLVEPHFGLVYHSIKVHLREWLQVLLDLGEGRMTPNHLLPALQVTRGTVAVLGVHWTWWWWWWWGGRSTTLRM